MLMHSALLLVGFEIRFPHMRCVRRYGPAVFDVIYGMVRQREQAEDLTQETFLKIFGALGHNGPERKPSAWIGRIADNTAIDYVRRGGPDDARALLDVHEPEPFDASYPLLGLPNARLYPHLASRTAAAQRRMSLVVEDVLDADHRAGAGDRLGLRQEKAGQGLVVALGDLELQLLAQAIDDGFQRLDLVGAGGPQILEHSMSGGEEHGVSELAGPVA